MAFNILVVDDETEIQKLLKKALQKNHHYSVRLAGTAQEAKDNLSKYEFQVALLDLNLPDSTGLELLEHLKEDQPLCRSIVMTGYGTTKTAVQAIKLGAYDYIEKTFTLNEILQLIRKASQLFILLPKVQKV